MKKMMATLLVLGVFSSVTFAEDAAKLFGSKCAMCHGKDAKGNPGMAKKFGAEKLNLVDAESLAKTDEEWVAITLAGAGKPSSSGAKPMPAYKGKVNDADAAALAAYIRGLAPKK